MKLDDAVLVERGYARQHECGGNRLLVIACGALAREIIALIEQHDWSHIDLKCLPAKLHLYPERIPESVAGLVNEFRDCYAEIFVAYADCGTGGLLEDQCRNLGVTMIDGPHCYSFFEGNEEFSARAEDEISVFYLTDFLVRQFDAFVWKPLGLDRHPELKSQYFGNYRTLVYQSQKEDPVLQKKARSYARRLGLAYEYRFTGYGDLRSSLTEFAGRSRASSNET